MNIIFFKSGNLDKEVLIKNIIDLNTIKYHFGIIDYSNYEINGIIICLITDYNTVIQTVFLYKKFFNLLTPMETYAKETNITSINIYIQQCMDLIGILNRHDYYLTKSITQEIVEMVKYV